MRSKAQLQSRIEFDQGEPAENSNRWLVSYADFMTLLMAFFVVMYSLSQVSDDHFRVLSSTVAEAFSAKEAVNPVENEGVPQLSFAPSPIDLEGNALEDTQGNNTLTVPDDFLALSQVEDQQFEVLDQSMPVASTGNEKWFQIELPSEVLFKPAAAKLNDSASTLLADIAQKLQSNDHIVRVEGFTDNAPINSPQYPSNWELSASRAAAVVKQLVQLGIEPDRLSAVGHGAFRPVATNSTAEGRALNRRILISVSSTPESQEERLRRARFLQAPETRRTRYELRPALPEGVKVYGLDKPAAVEASEWLSSRLGRSSEAGTISGDIDARTDLEPELLSELQEDASAR